MTHRPLASSAMHVLRTVSMAFGVVALGAGCRSTTHVEPVDRAHLRACPQGAGEFSSQGCARLLAIVEGPPIPWPARYRFDVRAVPASGLTGPSAAFGHTSSVGPPVPLRLMWWHGPPPGTDTSSVWVVARMLLDPQPVQVGVPLPVFAADSVLHVVRVTPVGAIPPVDTVYLTLRRP